MTAQVAYRVFFDASDVGDVLGEIEAQLVVFDEPARVRLEIEAQSDMGWVVVTDPVPAGASLLGSGLGRDSAILTAGERREGWVAPAYEERRFDAFRAYYSYVPKGTFVVEYTVRLNNSGSFVLPATRVEAMYAPEMFGELPNATLQVRSGR